MIKSLARNGYVMLVTVLLVGTVATGSAITILLLGLSIERNAFSIQLSAQALAGSNTCIENAILRLQNDLEYAGNEPFSVKYAYQDGNNVAYDTHNCYIYPVGGDGNNERIICAESQFGNYTLRRIHVVVDQVLPVTEIDTWEEVASFPTECGTYTGNVSAPNCGNNIVNAGDGEECDDGNLYSNDGCSSNCRLEFCGDGVIQISEQCDDGGWCNGGSNDGDPCTGDSDCTGGGVCMGVCTGGASDGNPCDQASDCSGGVCGGLSNDGQRCIGGDNAGASCSNDGQCPDGYCSEPCDDACDLEVCGDGVIQNQSGEQCDDGVNDGTLCLNYCQTPRCGDSIVQTGEECDNGGYCFTSGLGCTDNRDCINLDDTCSGGTCVLSLTACIDNDDCPLFIDQCKPGRCYNGVVYGTGCDNDADCGGDTCEIPPSDSCDNTCQNVSASGTIPDDYIMYWKFDESSGSTAPDETGTYPGTLKSMSSPSDWETDVPYATGNSNSLDFDGSNDYVQGSSSTNLYPDEFTVSFWMKHTGFGSAFNENGIVCKTNGNSWSQGWGFYYKPAADTTYFPAWNGQKRIHFFVEDWQSTVASGPISDETAWNHVVGTYDGTTLRIYINGVLSADDDSYSGTLNKNQTLEVGRCGHNSYSFSGNLDEVRIYDYVLSAAEIQAIYSQT